jgi:hypothetical protein
MRNLRTHLAAFMVAVLLSSWGVANNESVVESKVTDVTLYRDQAQVTREIDVAADMDSNEIVVGNLPENVLSNSLFAESTDGIEVRAVQFRTRAVGSSPREEVKQFEQEMRALDQKIALNQKQMELMKGQKQYLDKLENFVAPSATTELSKGVLDAEALKNVTEFNFSKREEIAKREIELANELYELQQEKNLLQRKLGEITNGSSKTIREAVLFVQKNDAGGKIRLSYMVNSCGWSPSYTIRAEGDGAQTRVEYNGLIYQMSGEDWKDVQLTLSTASPAISASGPGLAPFKLTLVPSQNYAPNNGPSPELQQAAQTIQSLGSGSKQLKMIYSKQKEAIYAVRNSVSNRDNFSNSWGLNDTVNQLSCVELISSPSDVKGLQSRMSDAGDQPSLNYTLDSAVSLTSRNSRQMVRIMQTDLESDFYHVASPILTSYVYREAELNNSSQEDLLAGPISVYLDGRFVGRGEIPTVARGQTFVVGFGADSQLRTRREMVDKSTDINGGNREISLEYRLVIENYKDSPVSIRISDRLPSSNQEGNIKITMKDPALPLSDDKVYLREERPKGLLRWDTEVPARAIGEDIHEISYSFSMEFDRKYQVAVAGDRQQQQEEFEQMQLDRIKR